MATDGVAKEDKDRKDVLEYLGVITEKPQDCYVYVNQPRRPFKDIWEDVEDRAIKMLCKEWKTEDPVVMEIGPREDGGRIHHQRLTKKLKGAAKMVGLMQSGLEHESDSVKRQKEEVKHENARRHDLVTYQTAMPHSSLDMITRGAPEGDYGQFALLHDDDKRWFLRGESTRAFIELKRCTCIKTCEDFSELVCSIAVGGLQDFHGRFWRAAFGLYLWGRAKLLKPILDAEVNRRLPKSRGYELKGPFLRPRADVLGVSELAVAAKAKLALMASEPPWQKEKAFGIETEERPPLDFNAGKPGGGVKMPTGVALYTGFGDLLHAQILCNDGKAMQKAYKRLTGKAAGTRQLLRRNSFKDGVRVSPQGDVLFMNIQGKEGKTKFGVLRVINSFREDQQKVIPLCASIKLICTVGWLPLGYGPSIDQLLEIEIMLKATAQARWLAKYMDITPEMMPPSRTDDDRFTPMARK
jgi:hypothetical protein